jgi:hypothetical protein
MHYSEIDKCLKSWKIFRLKFRTHKNTKWKALSAIEIKFLDFRSNIKSLVIERSFLRL